MDGSTTNYNIDNIIISRNAQLAVYSPNGAVTSVVLSAQLFGDQSGVLHVLNNTNVSIMNTDTNFQVSVYVYEGGNVTVPAQVALASPTLYLTSYGVVKNLYELDLSNAAQLNVQVPNSFSVGILNVSTGATIVCTQLQ